MGEASQRIERHIADERAKLDRNLDQIERKIGLQKSRFQAAMVLTGAVVGVGVCAGLIIGSLRR